MQSMDYLLGHHWLFNKIRKCCICLPSNKLLLVTLNLLVPVSGITAYLCPWRFHHTNKFDLSSASQVLLPTCVLDTSCDICGCLSALAKHEDFQARLKLGWTMQQFYGRNRCCYANGDNLTVNIWSHRWFWSVLAIRKLLCKHMNFQ
jgi:hypothetical protein